MAALCDLQKNAETDVKLSELDDIAGKAALLGAVNDREQEGMDLVPGISAVEAEAPQGALQQHKDSGPDAAQAEEEPSAKTPKKVFNLVTKIVACRDKYSNAKNEMKKRTDLTCKQARDKMLEVEAVAQYSTAKNALPLAEARLEAAESWATKDASAQSVFNKLKEKYKGKDPSEWPFSSFSTLQPYIQVEQAIAQLGSTVLPGDNAEASLKVVEETYSSDVVQPIKDMFKSLCDVKGQLTQAANRGEKKREKAAAEMIAAKQKATQGENQVSPLTLAQAVVSGRSTRAPPASMSLWHFDISQIGHPKINSFQVIKDVEVAHADSFGALPFLVRSSTVRDVKPTDVGLNSQISVFRNNFKVSSQAKEGGRAGAALRGMSDSFLEKVTKEVAPFIDGAAAIDSGLKALQLFGFVSNYRCTGRTEPQLFGCSRILLEGRRLVWTASIVHAVTAKRNLDPTGADGMDALVKLEPSAAQVDGCQWFAHLPQTAASWHSALGSSGSFDL